MKHLIVTACNGYGQQSSEKLALFVPEDSYSQVWICVWQYDCLSYASCCNGKESLSAHLYLILLFLVKVLCEILCNAIEYFL